MARLTIAQKKQRVISCMSDIITGKRKISSVDKRKDKISQAAARTLMQVARMEIDEYRKELANVLRAATMTTSKLVLTKAEQGNASLAQAAIALGVLHDKLQAEQGTSVPHTQVNVQVNGYSKEDIMAMLQGKQVKQADRAAVDIQPVPSPGDKQ